MLPKTVISRYSNTYAKKSKRLGIGELPLWRLKMVIFIYSNILLSVKYDQYDEERVSVRPERPLGLFEVLARNRQSALGLLAVRYAHENNHPECVQYLLDNNCPLPPVGDTKMERYARPKHVLGYTKRER